MSSINQMDIYQQMIIDHNRKPQNFFLLPSPTHSAEGFNPLCGDHLWLYLNVQEGLIKEVSFQGNGCAISKASASLMTEALKGKSQEDAFKLFHEFIALLKGNSGAPNLDQAKILGKLKVFSGIYQYPSRVKCAVLGWYALKAAFEKEQLACTENETPDPEKK